MITMPPNGNDHQRTNRHVTHVPNPHMRSAQSGPIGKHQYEARRDRKRKKARRHGKKAVRSGRMMMVNQGMVGTAGKASGYISGGSNQSQHSVQSVPNDPEPASFLSSIGSTAWGLLGYGTETPGQ